ncbi:MAG: protein kinase [Deltaproteobacteria bacterium]|nr:protein kinase [Deltaproteobacteria bacterium]
MRGGDADLSGTIIDDRYRLGDRVGRDRLGDIYDAEQLRLGRSVSIKILSEDRAPDAADRFRREAQALSKLSHPGIIFLLDFGFHEGRPYLVLDRPKGERLDQLLQHGERLPADEVMPILLQLCEALNHAHESGVLHRDLRLSCVIIGEGGRVQLTDFALARLVETDSTLTREGEVLGGSPFMSPEQAEGRAVDARSDLYSLGAIGYRLLTGRVPYAAPNLSELIIAQRKGPPPAVSTLLELGPESRGLAAVIERLLAHDPEERYRSATWTLNALRSSASALTLPDLSADAELLKSGPLPVTEQEQEQEQEPATETASAPPARSPATRRPAEPQVRLLEPTSPAGVPVAHVSEPPQRTSKPPPVPPPSDSSDQRPGLPPEHKPLDLPRFPTHPQAITSPPPLSPKLGPLSPPRPPPPNTERIPRQESPAFRAREKAHQERTADSLEDLAAAPSGPFEPSLGDIDLALEQSASFATGRAGSGGVLDVMATVFSVALVALAYGALALRWTDDAEAARALARNGQEKAAIAALTLLAGEKASPRISAALGYAQARAGVLDRAAVEYQRAAAADPQALEDGDLRVLAALLTDTGTISRLAAQALKATGQRALTVIRPLSRGPDPYVACRAVDVLDGAGDRLDVVSTCIGALTTRSCARRSSVFDTLAETSDRRAADAVVGWLKSGERNADCPLGRARAALARLPHGE